MNALTLYVKTCRLVLQTNQENKEFVSQLYKLITALRQSLCCAVCDKLLKDPCSSKENSCEHHVCKLCLGNMLEYHNCSYCTDLETFEENKQIKIILQCYIKLCTHIKRAGLVKSMCNLINNGRNYSLISIINEVVPEDSPIILDRDSPDPKPVQDDAEEVIEFKEEDESYLSPVKEELFEKDLEEEYGQEFLNPGDTSSEICDSRSTLSLVTCVHNSVHSTLTTTPLVNNINLSIHNTVSEICSKTISVMSQTSNIASVIPWVKNSQINNFVQVDSVNQRGSMPEIKVSDRIPQSHQSFHISNSSSCSSYIRPQLNHDMPKLFHASLQSSKPQCMTTTINSSGSKSCFYNVRPTQVYTGVNSGDTNTLTVPNLSNQAMYSVMYRDNNSTKITLKRNPIDVENSKLQDDKDQFKCPSVDDIKKRRPKPKPKRKGCRCGNATQTPGKLTCCGQRCPCYVAAKACIECQCRGCRNPHRPGGKKVRPHIPQLDNIQIHQVQSIHSRPSTVSSKPTAVQQSDINSYTSSIEYNTPITINNPHQPAYPTVQTLHNSHSVTGLGQFQTFPSGMHQLINVGNDLHNPIYNSAVNLHAKQEIALKPVSVISSVPTHFLINDDKSSNSASDASDVDVDV